MLKVSLTLILWTLAVDAQAQTDMGMATRRMAAVTSYCGGVQADWTAFESLAARFSGRTLTPRSQSRRNIEFTPVTHVDITVSDVGGGQLQCSTVTVRPDAEEYVSLMFGVMEEFPQYFGGPPDQNWIWPISPSSPGGRRGWRWVMITQSPMDGTSIVGITYFNYTP